MPQVPGLEKTPGADRTVVYSTLQFSDGSALGVAEMTAVATAGGDHIIPGKGRQSESAGAWSGSRGKPRSRQPIGVGSDAGISAADGSGLPLAPGFFLRKEA